jgi:hypothetical protein
LASTVSLEGLLAGFAKPKFRRVAILLIL